MAYFGKYTTFYTIVSVDGTLLCGYVSFNGIARSSITQWDSMSVGVTDNTNMH